MNNLKLPNVFKTNLFKASHILRRYDLMLSKLSWFLSWVVNNFISLLLFDRPSWESVWYVFLSLIFFFYNNILWTYFIKYYHNIKKKFFGEKSGQRSNDPPCFLGGRLWVPSARRNGANTPYTGVVRERVLTPDGTTNRVVAVKRLRARTGGGPAVDGRRRQECTRQTGAPKMIIIVPPSPPPHARALVLPAHDAARSVTRLPVNCIRTKKARE